MTTRGFRTRRALCPIFSIGVLSALLFMIPVAAGQSAFCHVTDGTFTVCPDGNLEWSDVTPEFFPESGSYLYADQADLDPVLGTPESPVDTFMLMYDETGRTEPLGPDEYFLVSFTTVEVEDGVEELEHYVIHVFTDGTIIFIEDGVPQQDENGEIRVEEIEGQRGTVGFGTSPNSEVPHVIVEFQIGLTAAGADFAGAYSPDPQFWSSTPPRPPRKIVVVLLTGFSASSADPIGMETIKTAIEARSGGDVQIVAIRLGFTELIAAGAFLVSNGADAEIVLIGHSFGGEGAVILSNLLNVFGVTVDKLVQIESVGILSDLKPNNVTTGLNYSQESTGMGPFGIEPQGERMVGGSTNVDGELHLPLDEGQIELTHRNIDCNLKLREEIVKFVVDGELPQGNGVTGPNSPTRNVTVLGPLTINGLPGLVSGTTWNSGFIQLVSPISLSGADGILVRVQFADAVLQMVDATGVSPEAWTVEVFGTVAAPDQNADDVVEVEFQFDDLAAELLSGQASGTLTVSSASGSGILQEEVNLTVAEFLFGGFTLAILQNGAGIVEINGFRVSLEADAITEAPEPPGRSILVYGPASGSTSFVNKANIFGDNITVFDAVEWTIATTATFQQFDVICIPTLVSTTQTVILAATNGAWGPAIMGNIVITGLHADQHTQVGATQYLENALAFAAAGGGTGFVSLADCFTSPAYFWVPQTGPFIGLTAGSCTSTQSINVTDPTHPVMTTPNVLTDGLLSNWNQSVHTFFPTVGGFTVIGTGSGGGSPPNSPTVLVAGAELPLADGDDDGVLDAEDNCPTTFNPDQADTDFNGIGDACQVADLEHGTAAFLQAGSGGNTIVEPTPLPVAEEPALLEIIVRIVDFRIAAGLTDSAADLTANLVDSLVEVGLVSAEEEDELIDDVLAGIDTDGDGIPDGEDICPESELSPTIVIDGCDSGVANMLFDDGCTMADLIAECADGASNHGGFVSCVAQLTNEWKQQGFISGQEKGAIQSCAAQADIP